LILSRFFSWFRNSASRGRLRNTKSSETLGSDKEKFAALEKITGVSIQNQSYYIQALTHRSYLESNDDREISNERLEFLGDSVLSLIVAQFLFEEFPDENEGFLTKIRAKFVNRNSVSNAAERLGIADFIFIGDNLSRKFINNSKTVLADTMEALIGAIFLDSGIEECRKFIFKFLIEPNIQDDDYLVDENYKSQLLEYTQANKIPTPLYEVINEEGPQHERIFTVRVSVSENEAGIGKGKNKKTAEQNAARIALKKILTPDHVTGK
jgi:ribonuclease-3